jgi:hypothetical protein
VAAGDRDRHDPSHSRADIVHAARKNAKRRSASALATVTSVKSHPRPPGRQYRSPRSPGWARRAYAPRGSPLNRCAVQVTAPRHTAGCCASWVARLLSLGHQRNPVIIRQDHCVAEMHLARVNATQLIGRVAVGSSGSTVE